eukprot:CAMPEP_0183297116 /NCGR_PEP_ID=MMETSP0160_2-20130417/4485_1 /TAXON_ID=2839 ORGANISM="Odontella Sinensis, Strain Grunow 1884" /NCGR_SAMPLE_ID=MMETSP0160_2 /ASSEMBLY_ACC=CAM_ASM_000250 /LENGTH=73 /DNA_ID=CAMNT_0025458867 /DNA_START=24 /DNA_END=242 /DNA_ORIENTATION=+
MGIAGMNGQTVGWAGAPGPQDPGVERNGGGGRTRPQKRPGGDCEEGEGLSLLAVEKERGYVWFAYLTNQAGLS